MPGPPRTSADAAAAATRPTAIRGGADPAATAATRRGSAKCRCRRHHKRRHTSSPAPPSGAAAWAPWWSPTVPKSERPLPLADSGYVPSLPAQCTCRHGALRTRASARRRARSSRVRARRACPPPNLFDVFPKRWCGLEARLRRAVPSQQATNCQKEARCRCRRNRLRHRHCEQKG